MRKNILFKCAVFCVLLAACHGSSAARSQNKLPVAAELEYVVEFVSGAPEPTVHVSAAFPGDASGKTRLALPRRFASAENLHENVRNLTAGDGLVIADTSEPHVKEVTHAAGQILRLSYDLVQTRKDATAAGRGSGYHTIVQPEFLHWMGYGAWVHPALDNGAPISVRITWKLPENWEIANSFGAGSRSQAFVVSMGDFEHAVYTAGDFRVRSVTVAGRPVSIAMRGKLGFSDSEFGDEVRRIFLMERRFFDDFDYPYYLITVLPLTGREGEFSFGGTGLTNSFATFITTNATLANMRSLLAHELFHNWNSTKLGGLQEPEQLMYWFSEGFTDYYTYTLLAREGLISPEEYVEHFNDVLRRYTQSPARDAPNERILKEFFTDPDIGQLPYWRGQLLALKWDRMIREASKGKHSLDDVMRAMFAKAKEQPHRQLSPELVNAHVKEFAGRDVTDDIRRVVVDGELVRLDPSTFGDCFELQHKAYEVFDLGMDLDTIVKEKRIANVKPESAAWKAGFRDGQTIVTRKPIHVGDPAHPVDITVMAGGEEKRISFLPVGKGPLVPLFVPKGGTAKDKFARCFEATTRDTRKEP